MARLPVNCLNKYAIAEVHCSMQESNEAGNKNVLRFTLTRY